MLRRSKEVHVENHTILVVQDRFNRLGDTVHHSYRPSDLQILSEPLDTRVERRVESDEEIGVALLPYGMPASEFCCARGLACGHPNSVQPVAADQSVHLLSARE